MTNNSRSSRREYKAKIEKFGIRCSQVRTEAPAAFLAHAGPFVQEEIFSSSYAAASYLASLNFEKKAYVVGGAGIAEELAGVGIGCRGVDEHARLTAGIEEASNLQIDSTIGAIVVGLDFTISYLKIAFVACARRLLFTIVFCRFALRHLQSVPDCLFIATNTDDTLPVEGGLELPGGGSIVAMVQCCSRMLPTVVGKPNQQFLDLIVKETGISRDRTVMVGDKLSTDILFGNRGGLKTLLVFTGVTSTSDLESCPSEMTPSFHTAALPDLMHLGAAK